jgi:hypothetical protein
MNLKVLVIVFALFDYAQGAGSMKRITCNSSKITVSELVCKLKLATRETQLLTLEAEVIKEIDELFVCEF